MVVSCTDNLARRGQIQLYSAAADGPVRWRLLGGNNRELGRGVGEYPDAESCRLAVKHLQASGQQFDRTIRRVAVSEWIWELVLEGEVVAFSGHRFDRRIRCELGVTQFLERLLLGEVSTKVMVARARGDRWRVVAS